MQDVSSAIVTGSTDRRRGGVRFTRDNIQEVLEFFPGLACCCHDGKILSINLVGENMLAIDDAQTIVGTPFEDLLAAEYQGVGIVEDALQSKVPTPAMLQRMNGEKVGVEIKARWAREIGEGTIILLAEDISYRMNLASDVLQSEHRFRCLVDNARSMICAVNDAQITFINRAGVDLLLADGRADIIGMAAQKLFHRDYQGIIEDPEMIEALLEEGDLFPARLARFNGTFIDVHVAASKVLDGDGYMLEIRDITEHRNAVMALHHLNQDLEVRVKTRTQELEEEIDLRRDAEEKLRHLATHDTLTGLPNRRLLMDRLEGVIHHAHREQNKAAAAFVDLDGFKAINDAHGHDAGDAVLICVAERLSALVRETDTVARLGGDEFVVLYSGISGSDDATVLAEKILASLAEPIPLPGGGIGSVGGSIGIALYPDHGIDSESLIKTADDLMYDVKKQGKNSYLIATP